MQYPAHSLTVIVKGTFDLRPDDSAIPSAEQLPIVHDLRHPDNDAAGPYYDSDLAYFKPRADHMLVGRCYAPGGRPITETTATFTVGAWGRRLRIIGDREWKRGMLKAGCTDPRPFTEMDLNWSRAYGGPRFAPNLVGRGYHRGSPETDMERLLPNVEEPKQPVQSPSDAIAPAGFCPIDRTWAPRKQMIGTYGKKWFRTRCPWVPEDIDWTVSNGAPAANQAKSYLTGDEQVRLENLNRASPNFTGLLPGLRVRALVSRHTAAGTAVEEVTLLLDTLWIDAEKLQAVLVWRGSCPAASEEFEDLDTLLLGSEPLRTSSTVRDFWGDRVQVPTHEPVPKSLFGRSIPTDSESPPGDESVIDADSEEEEESAGDLEKEALAKFPPPEEMLAAFRKRLAELPEEAPRDPLAYDERSVLLAAIELLEARAEEPEVVPWTRERVIEALDNGDSLREADLAGLDLSGIDFKKSDLRGGDLREASLVGANLAECNLSRARLDHCEASDASLAGAELSRASFRGASLVKANLKGARFNDVDFREADLQNANCGQSTGKGTDLTGAKLDRCSFAGSDLRGGNFSQAGGKGVHFEGARLDGSIFEDADLRESCWNGASCAKLRASRCDLSFADLTEASFVEVDLSQSRLKSVRGDRAVFVRSELDGADLAESDFDESDFSRASLVGANLSACSFRRAILRRARLEGTLLAKANLFEAMLPAAQLLGTDVRGANLFGADLSDIEGRGVILEGANLGRTRLDPD
jgi:uncharacterized protein YjbI with pentapeptide repeats